MNDKQHAFALEYLVDRNATQAATRAGYSDRTAYSTGQRLLKNVEVAGFISEHTEKRFETLEISGDRILHELARIAFGSLGSFVRVTSDGDAMIGLSGPGADLSLLSEATVEDFTDGRGEDARDVRRVKIKLHDKLAALKELAKMKRLHAPT
ncbi:terminase small subunit [Tropicimonas sp. IMCC34011]|uniref:terminase small subunit n=1 Tax=Tropicimonas sp. IMCC34011 TaxID=2248759 RepID=UPI0013005EDC|nr:terminase small subunit [Tropicimonas sp. IMCC34011]